MKTKLTKDNLEEIKELTKNYNELEKLVIDEPHLSSDRNRYSKDYSRILYSNSFRRLQGKMQLLSIASSQFYRNRLTHSQEVVQIARTIAGAIRKEARDEGIKDFSLYGSDIYVIESACLAHDIGNPPFGHAGERVLNDLMKDDGGYEGNAQTFRILNYLERRFPNERGLFLSKRTLLSVVKYFHKGNSNEKFLYEKDYDLVKDISDGTNISIRTLDAQIMDIADEIAYAAHDLEDALRQKLFTIDDLIFEFKNSEYKSAASKFQEIVEEAQNNASTSTSQSSEDYNFFFLKELTSKIVNTLVVDIGWVKLSEKDKFKTGSMNEYEIGYSNYENLSLGLKKLTFSCILRKPEILFYEMQGKKVIEGLFNFYKDNVSFLPPEYRLLQETESVNRIVSDYISGMMDAYAIESYKKIGSG